MARGREATAESGADAEAKAGAEAGAEGGPGTGSKGSRAGGSAGAGSGPGSEVRGTEPAGGSAPSPLIDLEFVKGLIEAVDGSGIDSLEITRAGTRVKISKTPPTAGPAPTYFAAPPQAAMAPASNSPPPAPPAAPSGSAPSEPSAAPAAEPAAADAGLVEIKSPMVGTFYRSPAPEAPPYVEVGTKVSKGQTLCILEAMKLMNELESEVDGVVKDVLVENAEPVEYGQVLFRIDPNG